MDRKLQNPAEGKSATNRSPGKKAKELQLSCKYCGKTYHSYNGLQTHVSHIHQGIRFRCSSCDKTYSRKSCLQKHRIEVHLPRGQHPFRCTVCDEGFQQWPELYHHKKTHQDPVELKCDKCPETFHTRKALREHVKESHTTKTEKKWQFVQKKSLYRNSYGGVVSRMGIRTSHPELSTRRMYRK